MTFRPLDLKKFHYGKNGHVDGNEKASQETNTASRLTNRKTKEKRGSEKSIF